VRNRFSVLVFGTVIAAAATTALPSRADGPPPLPDPSGIDWRRGLVQVEVSGRAVAFGAVLAGDGRIVTALSPLGTLDLVDVRYPDGHTVKGKLGHKDVTNDLALLVPQAGRWTEGYSASEQDPLAVELHVFAPGPGNRALVNVLRGRGRVDARAKDGTFLGSFVDVDVKSSLPGMPLLDPNGHAVGIVVHACRADEVLASCTPANMVAPVAVLRSFLVRTPANAVPPAPFLGINGAPDELNGTKGVRVVAVAPKSNAEKVGLKASADMIVAADGQPVDSPERLAEIIARHAVGETVKLNVFAAGKYREVSLILQAAP
jgi:serine protease Do